MNFDISFYAISGGNPEKKMGASLFGNKKQKF